MELQSRDTPLPPFFAAVRRRHPDVDIVLLPPAATRRAGRSTAAEQPARQRVRPGHRHRHQGVGRRPSATGRCPTPASPSADDPASVAARARLDRPARRLAARPAGRRAHRRTAGSSATGRGDISQLVGRRATDAPASRRTPRESAASSSRPPPRPCRSAPTGPASWRAADGSGAVRDGPDRPVVGRAVISTSRPRPARSPKPRPTGFTAGVAGAARAVREHVAPPRQRRSAPPPRRRADGLRASAADYVRTDQRGRDRPPPPRHRAPGGAVSVDVVHPARRCRGRCPRSTPSPPGSGSTPPTCSRPPRRSTTSARSSPGTPASPTGPGSAADGVPRARSGRPAAWPTRCRWRCARVARRVDQHAATPAVPARAPGHGSSDERGAARRHHRRPAGPGGRGDRRRGAGDPGRRRRLRQPGDDLRGRPGPVDHRPDGRGGGHPGGVRPGADPRPGRAEVRRGRRPGRRRPRLDARPGRLLARGQPLVGRPRPASSSWRSSPRRPARSATGTASRRGRATPPTPSSLDRDLADLGPPRGPGPAHRRRAPVARQRALGTAGAVETIEGGDRPADARRRPVPALPLRPDRLRR